MFLNFQFKNNNNKNMNNHKKILKETDFPFFNTVLVFFHIKTTSVYYDIIHRRCFYMEKHKKTKKLKYKKN